MDRHALDAVLQLKALAYQILREGDPEAGFALYLLFDFVAAPRHQRDGIESHGGFTAVQGTDQGRFAKQSFPAHDAAYGLSPVISRGADLDAAQNNQIEVGRGMLYVVDDVGSWGIS